MTRFCIIYSLEVGVISLCIISILVSGGLICNHQFKLPEQIRDWRNASIYHNDQLNMLDLNVKIAVWVLVGDILCTLLMILPVSMTSIEAPWKERNSRRKILIPCIVGKVLCILHSMVAFVWVAWKFHYKCPEIIGILLALALYVLLGWYVIVVVVSYYLHLGMRMTFHKLHHSQSDSTQRSLDSQLQYQKELTREEIEIPHIAKDEVIVNRKPGKALDQRSRDSFDGAIEHGGHEEHRTSQRKLYEYNNEDGRKSERRSHSSQEALDRRGYGSREKLRVSEIDQREEQYNKMLRKSRGSLDHIDEVDDDRNDRRHRRNEGAVDERQRKRDNIRQVGPDQIEYHVSEREETDGGGKKRYYYKRDKRDPYERSTEEPLQAPEMQKKPKSYESRVRRESEDSLGSMGRIRSPPKYAPPRHPSDQSYDGHEGVRSDPYKQRRPQYDDPYDRPQRRKEYQEPLSAAPPYRPYHRNSEESLDRGRSPPEYRPSPRMSDSSHDSYDRARPAANSDHRQHYYDPPQRYYDDPPMRRRNEQSYDNDDDGYEQRRPASYEQRDPVSYEQREPINARPSTNYRAYGQDEDDDDQYIQEEYIRAPPYEDTRYDQDGYVSSEV